jgi:hypothetical protein
MPLTPRPIFSIPNQITNSPNLQVEIGNYWLNHLLFGQQASVFVLQQQSFIPIPLQLL